MKEIKYREITAQAEDGRSLSLAYCVLVDKAQVPERYGVRVIEGNSGEEAHALDLTCDTKRIYDLVDKLARHSVTPATLADVVADWL